MKSQIFLFLLLLPLLALAAPMRAASAPEFDAVDACLAAQVRADRIPGLATPHRWWFGLPFAVDAPYLPDALPAGFLISNAEDMSRYLDEWVQAVNAHGGFGRWRWAVVKSPGEIRDILL